MIDTSYFIQDIALPNLDKVSNSIGTAITRYEKEILVKLLGYELWKEFNDAIEAGDPIDQKWLDLRDGADFQLEYNGKTYNLHWNGLDNAEKVSILSYYVYFKFRENTNVITTGIGDQKGKGENSVSVDDYPKMVNAWNEMVNLYGHIPKEYHGFWSMDNLRVYNSMPSAYNFLFANKDTYSDWLFQPIAYKNRFDV